MIGALAMMPLEFRINHRCKTITFEMVAAVRVRFRMFEKRDETIRTVERAPT